MVYTESYDNMAYRMVNIIVKTICHNNIDTPIEILHKRRLIYNGFPSFPNGYKIYRHTLLTSLSKTQWYEIRIINTILHLLREYNK